MTGALPENRNALSMWGTGGTRTAHVSQVKVQIPIDHRVPVIKRNYFAWPGVCRKIKVMPYTREMKKEALQFDIIYIRKIVVEVLKIDYAELLSISRHPDVVDYRSVVAWLCNKYNYETSMLKIGRLIGRDRTTAISTIKRANDLIETGDPGFTGKLGLVLDKLLNGWITG